MKMSEIDHTNSLDPDQAQQNVSQDQKKKVLHLCAHVDVSVATNATDGPIAVWNTTITENITPSTPSSQTNTTVDWNTTITQDIQTPASSSQKTTTVQHTVCYDSVGCFYNYPPFDIANEALPESPKKVGTTFLLYTPTDTDSNVTYVIDHVNETLLDESRYNPSLPTKFIIHGFSNTINSKWLYAMKDELLKKEDCNVIIVVWGPGAAAPNYFQAVANTRVVAKQIKMVIDMITKRGALLKKIHLIGHSLGAHTSGHVGYLLKPENKTIGRITGLDPAEPQYYDRPRLVRLDKADADYVDVIHTNGAQNGFGMWMACGDVDYYVNDGKSQPGCPGMLTNLGDLLSGDINGFGDDVSCSHGRAHDVFIESINTHCSFTSYPCESYEKFKRGECLSCGEAGCGVMGYYSDWYTARGPMYLSTRSSQPFCGHHYFIQVKIQKETRGTLQVQLNGTWDVSDWLPITSSNKDPENIRAIVLSKLKVSKQEVGLITSINIKYTKAPRSLLHWWPGDSKLKVEYVSILAGENGKRYKLCIPEPVQHQHTKTVSRLEHHCQ